MSKIKDLKASTTGKTKTSLFSPLKSGLQSKITINPQDDIKTSNINDGLVKIYNFDNGNALKDYKGILDSMKQQISQEKQKLSLFYKDQSQLLEDLNIKSITLKKIVNNDQSSQSFNRSQQQNISKKSSHTFNHYTKLLKHALKQSEKYNFLLQQSKKNKTLQQQRQRRNQTQQKKGKSSQIILEGDDKTILQRIVYEKKNELAFQFSSNQNHEQKNIKTMMKNRKICEMVLQQALLFERYYSVLKKTKAKVFDDANKSKSIENGLSTKQKQPAKSLNKLQAGASSKLDLFTRYQSRQRVKGLQSPSLKQIQQKKDRRILKKVKQQNTKILKDSEFKNRSKINGNSFIKVDNQQQNDLCANPKHLRLYSQLNQINQNYSQQDHNRNSYISKLKREYYYKQMRKINDQIVEKKNFRNNILIKNLLNFIRNNSLQDNQPAQNFNQNQPKEQNQFETVRHKNTNSKPKYISGSNLTKLLKKIFLIYSFSEEQQFEIKNSFILSKKNLQRFFEDFQIDVQKIQKNQKIMEIIQKQNIDEFQFIQLIHLLSISVQQNYYFDHSDSSDGVIYTNINKLVSTKILNPKYSDHLAILQQKLLKNILPLTVQKLRKLNRFEQKLHLASQLFFKAQNINKLSVQTIFQDFDYVVQALWHFKIYPNFVNKKTVRFYHNYLKQDKQVYLFGNSNSKNKQLTALQNIIWLVIAKISIEQLKQTQKLDKIQFNEDSQKKLQTIFMAKFKIILKAMLK